MALAPKLYHVKVRPPLVSYDSHDSSSPSTRYTLCGVFNVPESTTTTHFKVAIANFKNVIMPPALGNLQAYMNRMLDLDIFQQSSYPPDVITWGWGNARAAAAASA